MNPSDTRRINRNRLARSNFSLTTNRTIIDTTDEDGIVCCPETYSTKTYDHDDIKTRNPFESPGPI